MAAYGGCSKPGYRSCSSAATRQMAAGVAIIAGMMKSGDEMTSVKKRENKEAGICGEA
jgi:hypothetical protein